MVKIECNLGDKGIYMISYLPIMESHHILYYVCGIAGTKKNKALVPWDKLLVWKILHNFASTYFVKVQKIIMSNAHISIAWKHIGRSRQVFS